MELLSNSPSKPLASYTSALDLLAAIPTIPQVSLASSSTALNPKHASETLSSTNVFTTHRELWRWVEHALYRGSLLASQASLADGLKWIRSYSIYESFWPASFRSIRRSKISTVYLMVLAHSYGAASTLPSTSTGLTWHAEAQRSMRSAWSTMEGSGRAFPKAGEKREEVEEFAVSCVALWERGGQKTGSELELVTKVRRSHPGDWTVRPHLTRCSHAILLIQILWWATTQTFNSQPILRHLTRLLLADSLPLDAKRTFELYVQLVDKARETAAADVDSSELDGNVRSLPEGAGGSDGVLAKPETLENLEGDDDETYIEMLAFGARMIGKECKEPKEGLRWIIKAKETLQKSRQRHVRESEELRGRIDGVLGMLRMELVAKGASALFFFLCWSTCLEFLLRTFSSIQPLFCRYQITTQ